MSRVVVVGAGLAGLSAALWLARAGEQVSLVHAGIGGLPLAPGTVDVFGYAPGQVTDPFAQVAKVEQSHPYAMIGVENTRAGVEALCEEVPRLLEPGNGQNRQVVTALGVLRPAYLVPPTLGVPSSFESLVIVGFEQLKDFSAPLVAASLGARSLVLDFPARPGEQDGSALSYAKAFDEPEFRQRFVEGLRALLGSAVAVGLPAVLGRNEGHVSQEMAERLGAAVFEIVTAPPSVPGVRLNDALTKAAKRAGVRFISGSRATGFSADGQLVVSLEIGTAGRPTTLRADHFVLAAGGLESQGLVLDSYQRISEPIFNLPVFGEPTWSHDYWGEQPILRAGLRVDERMRPVDQNQSPIFTNLYAVGGLLGGANRIAELSGDGIALGSAWAATSAITSEGGTK